MATIVNTPSARETNDSWVGTVIGVLVVGFLLILFFAYGLPFLRGAANSTPATQNNDGGINVNIPDRIDVNSQQPAPQP